MIKPTPIPNDIRELNPKKGKICITDEAVESAKKHPNQPILLGKGAHIDNSYAGTIAWQAQNSDPELGVYWSFQEEGKANSGSYVYKGPAFLSYGEVPDAPKPPVAPVAPRPSSSQLASVLTADERANLLAKVERASGEREDDKAPSAKELMEYLSPRGKDKLAERYWERRGMSAGVAKRTTAGRSEKAKRKSTEADGGSESGANKVKWTSRPAENIDAFTAATKSVPKQDWKVACQALKASPEVGLARIEAESYFQRLMGARDGYPIEQGDNDVLDHKVEAYFTPFYDTAPSQQDPIYREWAVWMKRERAGFYEARQSHAEPAAEAHI